jgi:DnaK suppressor protein
MSTVKEKKSAAASKKIRELKGVEKEYYNLLMATRGRLLQHLQYHTDEALNSQRDSAGEKAGMATHMADLGSDNSRHELDLKLLTEEGDAIELIEECIEKLYSGEYGVCEDCGCKIPHERLITRPYARFCVKCKSNREKGDR